MNLASLTNPDPIQMPVRVTSSYDSNFPCKSTALNIHVIIADHIHSYRTHVHSEFPSQRRAVSKFEWGRPILIRRSHLSRSQCNNAYGHYLLVFLLRKTCTETSNKFQAPVTSSLINDRWVSICYLPIIHSSTLLMTNMKFMIKGKSNHLPMPKSKTGSRNFALPLPTSIEFTREEQPLAASTLSRQPSRLIPIKPSLDADDQQLEEVDSSRRQVYFDLG